MPHPLQDRLFVAAALVLALHLGLVAWTHTPGRQVLQESFLDEQALAEDLRHLRERLPPGAQPGSALVLVVIEGLRADGLEGMPRLKAWAEGGVVGTVQAVAPSLEATAATLATGLMPTEHRVTPDANGRLRPLGTEHPTLAGRLAEAGASTVQLHAARLDRDIGLDKGFQAALGEDLAPGDEGLPYVPADRLLALARAALEAQGGGSVFLQLHLADTLSPWIPRRGACTGEGVVTRLIPPGGARPLRSRWLERRVDLHSGAREATPEERLAWAAAWRCEVAWVDAGLGALLEALPGLGLGPEDRVVVVGGFGQDLGEPGPRGALLEWGRGLGPGVLQVPLLAQGPGVEALAGLVSLRQLPGALLDLLGLEGLDPSRAEGYEALTPPVALSERTGPRAVDLRSPQLRALRVAEAAAGAAGALAVVSAPVEPELAGATPAEAQDTPLEALARRWMAGLPAEEAP